MMGDDITLADLSAACEIAQLEPLQDVEPEILQIVQKLPKLSAWMKRMMEIPEMDEAHMVALPMLESLYDVFDNNIKAKL